MSWSQASSATKISFALSVLGLLSACVLFAYLEASPTSPTPLDALKALTFPDAPTQRLATVQGPATFDFSEANLLLAWAVATAFGACFGLVRALTVKATTENAQPRAIAIICSLLAGICLLSLTPLLMSVYRVTHG
jgi:hypothetical protein